VGLRQLAQRRQRPLAPRFLHDNKRNRRTGAEQQKDTLAKISKKEIKARRRQQQHEHRLTQGLSGNLGEPATAWAGQLVRAPLSERSLDFCFA
jgi:hypothetical protein